MKRIWAFITGQRLVWLKDHDGEVTLTFAKPTPFGLMAKRHWPFNIRNVLCVDGGAVEGGSYVAHWKFADGTSSWDHARAIAEGFGTTTRCADK